DSEHRHLLPRIFSILKAATIIQLRSEAFAETSARLLQGTSSAGMYLYYMQCLGSEEGTEETTMRGSHEAGNTKDLRSLLNDYKATVSPEPLPRFSSNGTEHP
ncbi:hypothetical protein CLAIMM_06163, partial [Cladophialophora immunda]